MSGFLLLLLTLLFERNGGRLLEKKNEMKRNCFFFWREEKLSVGRYGTIRNYYFTDTQTTTQLALRSDK